MKYSPVTEDSQLLLPCSRSHVSPGKEISPSSGTPIFAAAAQGTPLECLALVASGAYTHHSQETVTDRERVLNGLPSPGPSKRPETAVPRLSVQVLH